MGGNELGSLGLLRLPYKIVGFTNEYEGCRRNVTHIGLFFCIIYKKPGNKGIFSLIPCSDG